MDANTSKKSWIFIAFCAVGYLLNIIFSKGIYDTSDGLAHFEIARYAFAHPALFLDHWGKPLFTFLAAPFAQFGIKGVLVFNLIVFVFTARILVRFLEKLKAPFAWLSPVVLALAPAYYQVLMSGLTEVLFAGLLLAALYYFSEEKYKIAALLVSAMLFSRSESYFVLPFFALAFLLKKEWKPLLLLAVFPVLMSFLGGLILDDFLWMINKNPYVGAAEIYGSGDGPWYFLERADQIWGWYLAVAALVGSFVLVALFRSHSREPKFWALAMGLFISLSIVGAHSIFWWKGLYGSFGLLRVLATVIPVSVLLFFFAFSPLLKPKFALPFILAGLFFGQQSLRAWQPKFLPQSELETEAEALKNWLANSAYAEEKNIWFMHPVFQYELEIDAYEKYTSQKLWSLNHVRPSTELPVNALLLWDNWHAPNEGHTSLETLQLDEELKEVYRTTWLNPGTENDSMELRVFAKIPPTTDTLIALDFSAGKRPILEDRYEVIQTQEDGRKYQVVSGDNSSVKLYSFWTVDQANWQSKWYDLQVEESGKWQLVLVDKYENQPDEVHVLGPLVNRFSLPEAKGNVVMRQLYLHNLQKIKESKLYGWRLRRSQ